MDEKGRVVVTQPPALEYAGPLSSHEPITSPATTRCWSSRGTLKLAIINQFALGVLPLRPILLLTAGNMLGSGSSGDPHEGVLVVTVATSLLSRKGRAQTATGNARRHVRSTASWSATSPS